MRFRTMQHQINPRALFGLAQIAPHVFAFNDDPDDDGTDPGASGANPDGGKTAPNPPKSFSQEDLDAAIKDRLKRQAAQFEKKFEGIDLDEYRKLKAAADKAAEQKLLDEKQYDEVLSKKTAAWEKERAELVQKYEALQSKYQTAMIDRELVTAARQSVKPEQVAALLRGDLAIDDDGNVFVRGENGPRLDEKGNVVTVADYVAGWLKQNDHYLPASAGTGAGAGGSGANGSPGGFHPGLPRTPENLAKYEKEFADLAARIMRGEIQRPG